MIRLLVPHHLPEVAAVDLLAANRANVKMIVTIRNGLVGLAGLWWSKVCDSHHDSSNPAALQWFRLIV
jgi:hypothetical protein